MTHFEMKLISDHPHPRWSIFLEICYAHNQNYHEQNLGVGVSKAIFALKK